MAWVLTLHWLSRRLWAVRSYQMTPPPGLVGIPASERRRVSIALPLHQKRPQLVRLEEAAHLSTHGRESHPFASFITTARGEHGGYRHLDDWHVLSP